ISEERRKDVFPVISRGWTAKIDAAELAAVAPGPAAVVPWTDHQEVLFRSIVALEQLVDLDRAVEVFLIPPPGNVQNGHRHAGQPGSECLTFPERIVVGLRDKIG